MYMTWDGLLGELTFEITRRNFQTHFLVAVAAFGGIFGLCLGGSVLSLVEMVYYFTLRLFNRIVSILQKDQPPTRQVSPIKKHKPNFNDKQGGDVHPLKKTRISDSKLQTFGKNIIGYEPFTVKGSDAFKKINGFTAGGERYYLK